MNLSSESVGAYKALLVCPELSGVKNLDIRPIGECFRVVDVARAQHLLYEDYRQEVPGCPKVIFYIVMQDLYPHLMAKDRMGCLGFCLEYVPR